MHVTRQGTNDAMTPESIQAMIDQEIQRNATHTQDDASQSLGGGLGSPMQTARIIGLSQWLKKMESVFHISGCAIDNQVKIMHVTRQGTNDAMTPESIQAMIDQEIQRNATHTQDDASQSLGGGLGSPMQTARAVLTWWNGHVRTLGHEAAYAMTWGTLKKKMTDKYCPKNEIKKLEIELWNLRVKGNDVIQELALIPKNLDETIELANDLMDQKLCTYTKRQNENKRKVDDALRNNQQQPHKKQNVARAYTVGPGKKKVYTGDLPLCTKCNYHHTRQCAPKCRNCKRYGHTTMDCQENCPKLKNRENGNGNDVAQRRAYALGRRMLARTLTLSQEAKDKSEGKRLEDVPIVRDFPKDLPERRNPIGQTYVRGSKETHLKAEKCTKSFVKEAHQGIITDCHAGNSRDPKSDPTAQSFD
nr:hypothetical protein [Tanacetum cinerariifolium]